MLVVRAAGPGDIDALMDLAYLSGTGFTSLPEHRPTLEQRLALSEASFSQSVAAEDAWYVLMLENSETGQIEGVAGVKGGVGLGRPHNSFRVVTLAQYSSAINTRFEHQALVLVNECSGFSEVGSLFLRPGKRQSGAGSLLARSRYMLIGANRDRFRETIMAELRGWFDEADNSPFWNGISSKFFRLPFEEADRMISSTDGQFIADLAPRHPIYLELVDADARKAIGAVHRHGVRAMSMLEAEGFTRSGLIDIFDGGPTVICARENIRTIRESRPLRARTGNIENKECVSQMLVANDGIDTFRAIKAAAVIEGDSIILPPVCAEVLRVNEGDAVLVSPCP